MKRNLPQNLKLQNLLNTIIFDKYFGTKQIFLVLILLTNSSVLAQKDLMQKKDSTEVR